MKNAEKTFYVYALVDKQSDEIFYIGKTCDLDKRLWQHLEDTSISAKVYRIFKCKQQIEMRVLRECHSDKDALQVESDMLTHYIVMGAPITNVVGNSNPIILTSDQRRELRDYFKSKIDSRLNDWWQKHVADEQILRLLNYDDALYQFAVYLLRQCSVTSRYLNLVEIKEKFGLDQGEVIAHIKRLSRMGIQPIRKKIGFGKAVQELVLISVNRDRFVRVARGEIDLSEAHMAECSTPQQMQWF